MTGRTSDSAVTFGVTVKHSGRLEIKIRLPALMARSALRFVHPGTAGRVTDREFIAMAIHARHTSGGVNVTLALRLVSWMTGIAGVLSSSFDIGHPWSMGPVHGERHVGDVGFARCPQSGISMATCTQYRLAIHQICIVQTIVVGKDVGLRIVALSILTGF